MMQAKDTVMNDEQIIREYDKRYKISDGRRAIAKAQAEISFKAGMKEVVETYKRENPSIYQKYRAWWQAKEKKWGRDG